MKNWIKRLSWFSRKDRTYFEDEHSLFFAETLPGEPERGSKMLVEASAGARTKHVERPAKYK